MTINNDSRHCKCVLGENRPWLRIPDLWGKVFQISIRDPRSPYPLLLQCPHPIVSGSIFSSLFELGLYLISALYQDFSSLWEEDQKRTQERCFPMGQSFLGGRRGELRGCLRETASCPFCQEAGLPSVTRHAVTGWWAAGRPWRGSLYGLTFFSSRWTNNCTDFIF